MPDDASATFRGFRHQALYVLSRLLTDADATELTYRPEGSEDLAIYDAHFRLIEAVQVKDHTSDLSLSKLKPAFWERFHARRKDWPDSKTKLATFGEIGPELKGAIEGQPVEREKVLAKLCTKGSSFKKGDAQQMLDHLRGNVLRPVASQLTDAVHDALRDTNVGGDVESAAELLMFWVFDASERQRALTRLDLISQLQRIGAYLAALRDSSAEWGTNISPVCKLTLTDTEKERWVAEYRKGVQARWEHIVAGADCERAERLAEIHHKLANFPVVIIRGASGQGKSTLGWRYLHDYGAEGMRFHIRRVEGRAHAATIASALGDHVRKLNLKAIAYVDVAPPDVGWSELIAELAAAGLSVLVAVREEDFRRANLSTGDFYFSEVLLDHLTREEAEPIFGKLHRPSTSDLLDFNDAWTRFGAADGGPLMEFTHLVTQGELLQTRIVSQVFRLQIDATKGNHGLTKKHIELLALATVANETGARVSLAGLCAAVGIPTTSLPLHVLEEEYLLRLETDGGAPSVAPLHALRSKAVVGALFGEVPVAWADYAERVLPLILDTDVEPFLLAAFSRRSEYTDRLVTALNGLQLRSWTHAAGIAASLLWEGVSRYEVRNRETIRATIEKFETAWWMACDSFVGLKEGAASDLHGAVQNVMEGTLEVVVLTPKVEVFFLFRDWSSRIRPPLAPRKPSDWRGAGDIAHWLGHCGSFGEMRGMLEQLMPSEFPLGLDIETISSYISGRAQLEDALFEEWHNRIIPALTQRFLDETTSEHLADDGENVTVYFSTPLADIVCRHDPKAMDWHWQTMKRVRLLKMLFPKRKTYGSQGLGLTPLQLKHDPTFKRIPTKSLPNERATHLNALFLAIVAYRHHRVNSWKEYSDAALNYRQTLCECFRKLHKGWAKLLSANPPPIAAFGQLPGKEIDALKRLSKLPMFPRSAVDEWGFISEDRSDAAGSHNQRLTDLLLRFGKWRKAFSDFETGAGRVYSNIITITAIFAAEHKGHQESDEDRKVTRLTIFNLAAAWEALPEMQSEFRKRFGHLYSVSILDELDRNERSNFRHLWSATLAMCNERKMRVQDFGAVKEQQASQLQKQFLREVASEIENVIGVGSVSLGTSPWRLDGEAHLRIVCNHSSVSSIDVKTRSIIQGIWRACHFKKWRDAEWQPLVMAWPKLAVVHILKGKALSCACVRMSTKDFFRTEDNFEVQLHHVFATPVNPTEYARSGIVMWENPLMERVLLLQGAIIAFCITAPRFFELFDMAREQNLGETEIQRMLPRYAKELDLVWQAAKSEFELTRNALSTCRVPSAVDWSKTLQGVCEKLLFSVNPDTSLSLTPDDFFTWADSCSDERARFDALVTEMLTVILA